MRPSLKHTVLGLAALLLATLAAAAFFWLGNGPATQDVAVPEDRADLLGMFRSYTSLSDTQTQLRASGMEFSTEEGTTPAASDKRPPFRVDTIVVKAYEHVGHQGELRVEFFNDRLVGVHFYPLNIDAYANKLSQILGKPLPPEGEFTDANARVWRGLDYKGRPYVGCEDTRLAREMDSWIRRFS